MVGAASQLFRRNRGGFRTETGLVIMWIRPTTALTHGGSTSRDTLPVRGGARVPLQLLDTSSSRRRRIGSLQTPACRPTGVRVAARREASLHASAKARPRRRAWRGLDPHRGNGYWRSAPAMIATVMIAAAIQSTTTQNGGHHRVLATNWRPCCERPVRLAPGSQLRGQRLTRALPSQMLQTCRSSAGMA